MATSRSKSPGGHCRLVVKLWWGLLLLVAVPGVTAQVPEYLPHPPINIYGDAGFLLPDSGVIGGTGTVEDPYIIAGWKIDLEDLLFSKLGLYEGIRIQGTTAHFVIQDCLITGGALLNRGGIGFGDVANGIIQDVVIDDTVSGVELRDGTHDILLQRLDIDGPGILPGSEEGSVVGTEGIGLDEVRNVKILSVQIANHRSGLSIGGSAKIEVADSKVRGENQTTVGISMQPSRDREVVDDAEFRNVTVSLHGWGFSMGWGGRNVWIHQGAITENRLGMDTHNSSENLRVEGNLFANNRRGGIEGAASPTTVIRDNRFTQNGLAIRLGDGFGGTVQNNTMESNGRGAYDVTLITYRQPDMRILGNRILNNAGGGIELGYDSHNSTVEGNFIRDNGRDAAQEGWGITIMSDRNVVRFNHVNGNGGAGIEMWGVRNNTVKENDLSGNGGPDILWQRGVQEQNSVGPNVGVPGPGAEATAKGSPADLATPLLFLLLGLAEVRRRQA